MAGNSTKGQLVPEHGGSVQHDIHALYREHHGWLYAWLHRRMGNSCDAADLTHDTFTRILAGCRANMIPALHEPRAYLTTVAKRLLINHYERQSFERAYQASLMQLPEGLMPSVEEHAILQETLRELDRLLNTLPTKVRTAFLMSQLEGLTYENIAVRLRISVRTVTRYVAQGFEQCLNLMLDLPA